MNTLMVGDLVGWSSAAGYKEGVVKNIVLSRNAAGNLVPWIDIDVDRDMVSDVEFRVSAVRLCASESNMKMMRLIKIEYMDEMV